MTIKGIIIRCSAYKDYDAMINLLTKEGLLSFKARSVFKYENKNSILSTPLLYGDFTFSDNKDKFLLYKEINPLFDSRKYLNDLKILSFVNLINEIILKLVSEEDLVKIYEDLIFILKNIENINLNLSISYFISKVLIIAGYGLDTSNYNDDKNISFDFINSKFIDISNFDENRNRRYSKEEKIILHEIFNNDIKNIKNDAFNLISIKRINNDLFNYIDSTFQVRLKSAKIIEKVL